MNLKVVFEAKCAEPSSLLSKSCSSWMQKFLYACMYHGRIFLRQVPSLLTSGFLIGPAGWCDGFVTVFVD